MDFVPLDADWKSSGREHAGIIIVHSAGDFGELLRRVERHLNTYAPDNQHNTLLWLKATPTR